MAPEREMFWLPLTVAMAAILATILLVDGVEDPRSASGPGASGDIGAPEAEQAQWSIETRGVGAIGKVTKFDRKRVSRERGTVKTLVRELYGGLFLDPDNRQSLVREHFAHSSAKAFVRTRAGTPINAVNISTTRRDARVSFAIHGAREAVAEVDVVARAVVRNRPVRIFHRSTLWMERVHGDKWRVVAFDVKQRQSEARRLSE